MPENPYLQYLQGAGSNQNYIPTQEGPIYADWTTPDDIEVERNNSMLYELVGSGLWAFMDEGLFGVPGMIGGQEFQQDMAPETFLGQMSAGIGGIAGYAAGAPLKLGRKAISMAVKKSGVAEQLIKAGGEKFVLGSAESVARKSVKNAVDAGLKREIAEDVGQSYINLARRGQMGADLAGAFGRKSGKVIDEVVGDYAAKGLIGVPDATSALSTATTQTVELAKKAQEIFTKVDQSLGIQDVRITNLRDKLAGIETQLNNQ